MTESPKNVSAASKLMSSLTGQTRPANTLPRQSHKLSRQQLSRELDGFYNNCVNLIRNCAQISGALRAPEIRASKDFDTITKTANVLNSDLTNFSERLKGIYAEQQTTSQLQADDDFHMETLRLGEAYSVWTMEFTQVVVPTFQQLVSLVESALPSEPNTQSVPQE